MQHQQDELLDSESSNEEPLPVDTPQQSSADPADLQPAKNDEEQMNKAETNDKMSEEEQKAYFELEKEVPPSCKDLKLKQFFQTTTSIDGKVRRHLRISINSKNEQEYDKWREFLSSVRVIHCQIFDISNNGFQTIIPSIRHINFSQLKDLSLYNNQIASLDGLHYCDLENLENLRLDNNNLTYLHGLRKCRFLSLQQIDLQNNYIRDFTPLVLLEAPKLTVIRLEDWAQIPPTNDDKRWLVRVASSQLNYLRCPNPRRMRQLLIDKKLLSRFPKLNVMRCNRNTASND